MEMPDDDDETPEPALTEAEVPARQGQIPLENRLD